MNIGAGGGGHPTLGGTGFQLGATTSTAGGASPFQFPIPGQQGGIMGRGGQPTGLQIGGNQPGSLQSGLSGGTGQQTAGLRIGGGGLPIGGTQQGGLQIGPLQGGIGNTAGISGLQTTLTTGQQLGTSSIGQGTQPGGLKIGGLPPYNQTGLSGMTGVTHLTGTAGSSGVTGTTGLIGTPSLTGAQVHGLSASTTTASGIGTQPPIGLPGPGQTGSTTGVKLGVPSGKPGTGTGTGLTGLGGGTQPGITGLGGGALSGTTGLGGGALSGTTGLGGGALSGTTGLGGGALSGTTGLGGGALSGTTGLGGGAHSGTTGLGVGTQPGVTGLGGSSQAGATGLGGGTQPGVTGLGLGQATTKAGGIPGLSTTQAGQKPGLPLSGLGGITSAGTKVTGLPSLTTQTTTGHTGLTGSTGTSVGGATATKKYTYKELEELVNKWSRELLNQERVFMQQAQLVGQWDTMLQRNGDRIISLHDEMDRVKNEQKKLKSELDLIGTQQKDLEDVLTQLEANLVPQQPHLSESQHADIERRKTYGMLETIDSQLRHMGQDLKDVIEQMNSTASTTQEEDSEVSQIVKILNAHTDSLNWIDRNTALLQQKVDDVSQLTERHRSEHERSFHLAFGQ